MDSLSLFFERALAGSHDLDVLSTPEPLQIPLRTEIPPAAVELFGDYLEMVRLLGKRTAEMHLALAGRPDDPAFAPEPFTDFYRSSLYHGTLVLSMRTFETLRNTPLAEDAQAAARKLLDREADVHARLQALRDRRIYVRVFVSTATITWARC